MSRAHGWSVYQAMHAALSRAPRTREPLNALVAWTEVGKALAGTLERVGGDPGLLRRTALAWCRAEGAAPGADLARLAYRLEPAERLTREDLARALATIAKAVERALPDANAATEGEARRRLFTAVVRGWFPVGLDILRAFPTLRGAPRAELLGALAAWCARYLPAESGPKDLGVRVERAR